MLLKVWVERVLFSLSGFPSRKSFGSYKLSDITYLNPSHDDLAISNGVRALFGYYFFVSGIEQSKTAHERSK